MDVPNHDLTPQIRLNLWPGGFWHLAQTVIQPQFREGSYALRLLRDSSPANSSQRTFLDLCVAREAGIEI